MKTIGPEASNTKGEVLRDHVIEAYIRFAHRSIMVVTKIKPGMNGTNIT